MPMMYQTLTSNIFSFKVVLISSSVLSAAIMLTVTDFTDHVPSIYNSAVSLLKPPYLYLVVNCIIISIVVSSKLHSTKDDVSPSSTPQRVDPRGIVPLTPVRSVQTVEYPTETECKYGSALLNDSIDYRVEAEKGLGFEASERGDATKNERSPSPLIVNGEDGGAFAKDAMSNKENEYAMAKSTWNVLDHSDSREYSPSNVKPPVSVRFSHRRNVKASPEGVRAVLGVSKPKRQDTLESTWKTITEGHQIPITRHLRKSDTWERASHGGLRPQQEKTMKKSETFNDRSSTNSRGVRSGKPRKEPSLSQDELNRRVEAFIKKFNEEMRLQRQESLNQYMEMINRGSH